MGVMIQEYTPLTALDLHLFNEGSHFRMHEKFGAHPGAVDGVQGTSFVVWAPVAQTVSVIGDFNGWSPTAHPLRPRENSGIWEGFIPKVGPGARYKYHIVSREGGYQVDKADPVGFRTEIPPLTASVVWTLDYRWQDGSWLDLRARRNPFEEPMAILEVHLGSWRRAMSEGNHSLGYRELAPQLADYVSDLGFTHVELLPIMEHPFYGSWGYQTTAYFAPTGRYGSPQDLMYLIDSLHQRGIGVILDWVPSHFPSDQHGLGFFDGVHLYEHGDPRQGYHPDWKSLIFDYGRPEVRSFLISSGLFWLDVYHADGIRVDAVASMLYLDYSRPEGQWIPNRFGGRENLEAIDFLRRLNHELHLAQPGIVTVAEESTSWPLVTRPPYAGGLGFDFKWDMGWMHDTLSYLARDPIYRKHHHNELTFRGMYAFSENFILPLSHDEVVHLKGSLLHRMPGDRWRQLAGLRLLLGYQYALPGKKLLFMGGEFGQLTEWNHDGTLDWHLLDDPGHAGVLRWVRDLPSKHVEEPALHQLDCEPEGFAWMDCNDAEQSVLTLLRRGRDPGDIVIIALNFTPVPRHQYRIGVPDSGFWAEILNSDAPAYGGSGQGNLGGVRAEPVAHHGQAHSMTVVLPPLAMVMFKPGGEAGRP